MRNIILSIFIFTCLLKNNVTGQYWSALGKGIGLAPWQFQHYTDGTQTGTDAPVTGAPVASLCIYNSELYVAGCYDVNGPTGNIVKWNGTEWSVVGDGVFSVGGCCFDTWINALLEYNGELYVAGRFTHAGNIEANNIAKWTGSEWLPVGDGLGTYGYSVSSLVVYNGELYAGGHFYNSGNVQVNNIAKWNGSEWSPVGTGIDVYMDFFPYGAVNSLAVHNGELYAGGHFDTAGVNTPSNIVKWDGVNWSPVGTGLDNMVFSLATYNGELYAGGYYRGLKKWNGTEWSVLNPGINGSVYTLMVDNGSLFAGGYFDTAGSVSANNIAKWNGYKWSALGKGTNKGIVCMAAYKNALFTGGNFDIAGNVWANQVAKWTEQCTSPPVQPENINSQTSICQNNYTAFSVSPVNDASDFTWTLPTGWTGNSISNSITAFAGTNGGSISVTANNPCGSSIAQTIPVTVLENSSYLLDTINGFSFVTPGQKNTYSINQSNGIIRYEWMLSGGGIITSGQASNEVTVSWNTEGKYVLSVTAIYGCGIRLAKTITIEVAGIRVSDNTNNPAFIAETLFEIKLLPNPSSGEFFLKLKRIQDKWIGVEVLNMSGQLLFRSGNRLGTNDYSQLISLNNIMPGIYVVKIIIDDKVYIKKISIVR